ncbi:MAG: hypothetical protein L0J06_10440, partial [Yaniella sp.]|nr:hypothetical protein [Yaniella sp.]
TQARFVHIIIEELTANGIMEPARLYESPYTDIGHVDIMFPDEYVGIVEVLREVKSNAEPIEAA